MSLGAIIQIIVKIKTFIQAHIALEIRYRISHSRDFSPTDLLNFKVRTTIPIQMIDKPYKLEVTWSSWSR